MKQHVTTNTRKQDHIDPKVEKCDNADDDDDELK